MLRVKKGALLASPTGFRSVLFRNQGTTLYDIHLVLWTMVLITPAVADEGFVAALSLLEDDLVEDATAIAFDRMVQDDGYTSLFALALDVVTTGGLALVPQLVIPYSKPFTVPYLSIVANTSNLNQVARLSVEIFFDRRQATVQEKAAHVGAIRSLARTT